MRILYTCLILGCCLLGSTCGRTLFDQLFWTEPTQGYYYPAAATGTYPAQYRPVRPTAQQRSYKDICRTVNTNGFTNPGAVPRCPY
ncbi:hypothetical protein KR222_010734 [Zaprionus bogoriensis]|nr:hypothetical protein KR222_010734 [Zaprionus bogoriensis]